MCIPLLLGGVPSEGWLYPAGWCWALSVIERGRGIVVSNNNCADFAFYQFLFTYFATMLIGADVFRVALCFIIMKYPFWSLVISFTLKSVLCDNMSTSTFFWLMFNIVPSFFNLTISLYLKWVSCSCHIVQFSSVQFSRSVVSDSLRPHELQHARPPCPSLSPRVHSDSRPSSPWCHPAISSSVVPFSSCPQSLPASFDWHYLDIYI